MTWIVLKRIPGAGCWEKVTEAPDRIKAQWIANSSRSIVYDETWRVQNVESGEAWQCDSAPRKRAKWAKASAP